MKISKIKEILGAEVICGEEFLDDEVLSACGSDMMSDVLAFSKERSVLLTGLVNSQTIRTALMLDKPCVVFVRGKMPGEDVIELAKESGIVILTTDHRLYDACGLLYEQGLKGNGEV